MKQSNYIQNLKKQVLCYGQDKHCAEADFFFELLVLMKKYQCLIRPNTFIDDQDPEQQEYPGIEFSFPESTFVYTDFELDYGAYNSFENLEDDTDHIGLNGIPWDNIMTYLLPGQFKNYIDNMIIKFPQRFLKHNYYNSIISVLNATFFGENGLDWIDGYPLCENVRDDSTDQYRFVKQLVPYKSIDITDRFKCDQYTIDQFTYTPDIKITIPYTLSKYSKIVEMVDGKIDKLTNDITKVEFNHQTRFYSLMILEYAINFYTGDLCKQHMFYNDDKWNQYKSEQLQTLNRIREFLYNN